MADIELRIGRDVVVLSSPLAPILQSMEMHPHDVLIALLCENETIKAAYGRSLIAGAACLVAPTAGITPLALKRLNLKASVKELVHAALAPLYELKPQHILVEVRPCGLPFDYSSAHSLAEHRRAYAQTASYFGRATFDGFFLSGFSRTAALRPALEAFADTGKPVFVSVDLAPDLDPDHVGGTLLKSGLDTLDGYVELVESSSACALGVCTTPANAQAVATYLTHKTSLPLLMQLLIGEGDTDIDALAELSGALRLCGVQFLRAAGAALPLHTAALAATVGGTPVLSPADGAALNEALLASAFDDAEEDDSAPGNSTQAAPLMADISDIEPLPEDFVAAFSERIARALRENEDTAPRFKEE